MSKKLSGMQNMLGHFRVVALSIAMLIFMVGCALAREQIQIAGSSTVLPYAKIVADHFHDYYPKFKVPVVESGGSGAGIKEFCRGIGENTIDIVNASRKMKDSELQGCINNGVADIQEVRFGYDGIVIATDRAGPAWELTAGDIYKALAAKLVVGGKLIDNPYKNWHAIKASFPKWPIWAYIPGEKHGSREVLEEKLLKIGCKESGAVAAMEKMGLDKKAIERNCIAVRKDGAAIDIDGDYSETLARINANKQGMGFFGLAFYQNNADHLRVAKVNGITPSATTIASGEYLVSRPLFFYVKKAHLGLINGLQEYVNYFLSDQMIGEDSPTADYGLVVAPASERQAQRKAFEAGEIMALPVAKSAKHS